MTWTLYVCAAGGGLLKLGSGVEQLSLRALAETLAAVSLEQVTLATVSSSVKWV